MRSYRMNLTVYDLRVKEVETLKDLFENDLDTAANMEISCYSDNFSASFKQDLVGGETEEDFLVKLVRMIWGKTKRYVPIRASVTDLDSPVWDTYDEAEGDYDYFMEASTEHYEYHKIRFDCGRLL